MSTKNEDISSRSSRISAGVQSLFTLVLFIIILLIVNYVSFKHYIHKDLSRSQFYSLSPKTIDILKHLGEPVTVYTLLSDRYREPVENLLKEYVRIGGKNFTVERIDPAYDINRAEALQKKLHFDGSDHLVIFEYKDHDQFVKESDLFDVNPMTGQSGGFKGEQQFTGALQALLEGKASKIYFTEGHGEHPLSDQQTANGYGFLAQNLKTDNMETATLNLASVGEVPADADAVVIAGPTISFSPIETQALEKYVEGNGKLMVLADPYVTLGLDNLLAKYLLKYDNDLVLYRAMTATGSQMTLPLALIYQGGFMPHPITAKFAQSNFQLQIVGARSLTILPDQTRPPNESRTKALLQTDPNAFGWVNKAGTAGANMLEIKDRTFDKTSDLAGPMVVAAAYDGGTTIDPTTKGSMPATRVIAVGCSKFLENDSANNPTSFNFFTNCLEWLVKKDAMLDIKPKNPQEYGISISPMQGNTIWWCSIIFIPGAAFILGGFTWFSRRK